VSEELLTLRASRILKQKSAGDQEHKVLREAWMLGARKDRQVRLQQ
jgi:hypothetical protein